MDKDKLLSRVRGISILVNNGQISAEDAYSYIKGLYMFDFIDSSLKEELYLELDDCLDVIY